MRKYRVTSYVSIDDMIIEADNEEQAQDMAWDIASQDLHVYVELIEEDEEDA